MDLGLRDNVVFIAGSSRGIGQAIAHAFLKEQAKVVITGRNKGSLEEARNLLGEEASENQVLTVHGDMTDPIDIQRALEETISLFGNIDAVVANVGSGSARGGD